LSRIIAKAAIQGTHVFFKEAEERLNKAIEDKGEDQKVEFPETAYFLPMANALMGVEVKPSEKYVPFSNMLGNFYTIRPLMNYGCPIWATLLTAGFQLFLQPRLLW